MELKPVFSRATALIIFSRKKNRQFDMCHKVGELTHSGEPGLLGDPVSALSGVWRLQFVG